MLSIHLRGEAQRLLSGLTVAQLTNYHVMKQIITDRYVPKEKDVSLGIVKEIKVKAHPTTGII